VEASSKEVTYRQQGVSIITCTNRSSYIQNLFANFNRQSYGLKELIIIINHNEIPLEPYKQMAARHRNIRIYRLPERYSLGACLNYAIGKAKYGVIAKFDDDDYYAPRYIADSLQTLKRSKADVLGKRSHYMYLNGSKTLILRFPFAENRPASKLPGATLIIRKEVFNHVRFPNQNVGEDDLFCLRSQRKGFKVYSGNKYHFAAVRRKNSANHTWIISDSELLANHKRLPGVHNYKKYVQQKQAVL